VLRFERLFLANKHSLIPGSLVFTDGTYKHEGVSTTPPSASLYCERASYIDHAAVWLSYNVRMTTSGAKRTLATAANS
jgi:hypothetical protein